MENIGLLASTPMVFKLSTGFDIIGDLLISPNVKTFLAYRSDVGTGSSIPQVFLVGCARLLPANGGTLSFARWIDWDPDDQVIVPIYNQQIISTIVPTPALMKAYKASIGAVYDTWKQNFNDSQQFRWQVSQP